MTPSTTPQPSPRFCAQRTSQVGPVSIIPRSVARENEPKVTSHTRPQRLRSVQDHNSPLQTLHQANPPRSISIGREHTLPRVRPNGTSKCGVRTRTVTSVASPIASASLSNPASFRARGCVEAEDCGGCCSSIGPWVISRLDHGDRYRTLSRIDYLIRCCP